MTSQPAPVRTVATAVPAVAGRAAVPRRRPWLVFTVVVLAAFFGLIASRISLDQSAFTIDRLNDEITAEETRNMELELRVAELRHPDRIASRAAAMGMVYPSRQIPLDVGSGDPGPATGGERAAQPGQEVDTAAGG